MDGTFWKNKSYTFGATDVHNIYILICMETVNLVTFFSYCVVETEQRTTYYLPAFLPPDLIIYMHGGFMTWPRYAYVRVKGFVAVLFWCKFIKIKVYYQKPCPER